MESSLHRQLKSIYADEGARLEVPLGEYRIDVVTPDELVEIQFASLGAIRKKIRRLVERHRVLVVKPIVARKRIVRRDRKDGRVVARRWSPKRGGPLDLFDELVHFGDVFPHPNLTLEVPLVEIEEWRYPGHGRRRRRRDSDFEIEDQKLVEIRRVHRLRAARDLRRFTPARLPQPFHTGHLADGLGVPRWTAQRIAYCLRNAGAARQVGKQGNTRLYAYVDR